MVLGELASIYKEHGDLLLYFRDFDGRTVEAGCQYIHSSIKGFYKLIVPCDETETVMRLGTHKVVTRQKAKPCSLGAAAGNAASNCDIPVYVKYFSDTDLNADSARCEIVDGKLVFFNDKGAWDECENYKKRRDKARHKHNVGTLDAQLPVIRNAHHQLLSTQSNG